MNCHNRIRNYGFWIGIVALILLLFEVFGSGLLSGTIALITNIVLTLLVLLGIINNPNTSNSGYKDD